MTRISDTNKLTKTAPAGAAIGVLLACSTGSAAGAMMADADRHTPALARRGAG